MPKDPPFEFTDPRLLPYAPGRMGSRLPHLEKEGGVYFVTFRTADSVLPVRHDVSNDDDPEAIATSSEPLLVRGVGLLAHEPVARCVAASLQYFDGVRYHLPAWVVMPNHVHVVVAPIDGSVLGKILHSWKSFTAKKVQSMGLVEGALWQAEWFDHLIRSVDHLERFVAYVHRNPVAAGLVGRPEAWQWSSAWSGEGCEPT